ncbi:aminoacyl-tRNA hydrolase [Candidatus Gracilibacteria bacterium GN02-872]|nr:aminoacyl-tRNA hydrolase [Candidatus Gracilibacteria bacterium GN02-872]
MKIIIGLGNPGKEYENTRHNVGFMFLDYIKNKKDFSDFSYESKFKGEISTGSLSSEKVILLKPQTFMNLSGESVRKIVDFYKLSLEDFIVIYDDLSMEFGKIRFRESGSAGGHNGIKDIIRYFKEDFKRIKVGIGFNSKFQVSDWVLSKFSEEELIEFDREIFGQIEKILLEKI